MDIIIHNNMKIVDNFYLGEFIIMNELVTIWNKVLEIIKPDIILVSYTTWIETIIPVDISVDTITLQVPYDYCQNMIETRYKELIQNALFFVTKKDYNINIIVASEIKEQKQDIGMHLNPAYTFDTFVTGKSNQLAHAIAKNIAQCVSEKKLSDYNPMFLHGGVGLGKTHLMHAICHEVLNKRPGAKILYTTSEQFTIDLVNAIKDNNNQEFRDKYRTVDILLIDDIQFIGGKDSTQEEFFHTFNELYQQGHHIVITSDRPPKELYTLEERLRTRFECSGIYDINPPDFDTRVAILKQKADKLNIEIDNDILRYIAEQITSNIRELEGAIKMIKSYHNLANRKINMDLAKEAIKEYETHSKKTVTPEYIISNVAKYCNVNENDLLSATRSHKIAYPRQIAMYIMKEITLYSLPQIGDFFGRDHSTIIHGINKIKKDIEEDPAKKNLVDNIINNIKN